LPFFRNPDEVYAAFLIDRTKLGQQRREVGPFGQERGQRLFVERSGGGEQDSLGHAQMLRVERRC
jgi:hypothetical protein